MSYSMEFGTILPTRATPTATLLILSIIVVKFWINIIVTNEENATTPTKDIANSTVNVTFKLRLFCPVVRTIFSMNDCRLSLAHNVFAVYFSLGFETISTEILLTMIQCLLDICKAKIIVFRGSDRFCKCLILPPKLNKPCVIASSFLWSSRIHRSPNTGLNV